MNRPAVASRPPCRLVSSLLIHPAGPSSVPAALVVGLAAFALAVGPVAAQVETPVPPEQRGQSQAERAGHHDAANIRTVFYNYGMVGDYPPDPLNVDLSTFHSMEVPKGSGMNYSDGITPFVLSEITLRDGRTAYLMETGYRERQETSIYHNRVMRFEPRPGYFQEAENVNRGRSPAISNDPRTWPDVWPDKLGDPFDPGWAGQWNGYFGQRAVADQESFTVMDDDYYDSFNYFPDSRDSTRHGLGLRVEVRGFQWANPQASNVIFWHYDITNESTTDYNENVIFGIYMDSGVGGSNISCDGIAESDDDNAYFDRTFDEKVINLVYTWDKGGRGQDLSGCDRTGYLGYAYLETPGKPFDGLDNDEDGITDERRDGGPGEEILGQENIRAWIAEHYDLARFQDNYGALESRVPYKQGRWWTGDEDMDWNPEFHDVGGDGVEKTGDPGEGDGIPTVGEPNFDRTDLNESDQIGLTGFKFNRIKAGQGNPNPEVDNILFYTESQGNWPQRLWDQFTGQDPQHPPFDPPLAANYNLGFLFASGPFTLRAGQTERFSLALAYGGDLDELRRTVRVVQQIYDANYQFAVPPPMPALAAEAGEAYVRLSWDDVAERGLDPVTNLNDFEGYRIYRATDPDFRDVRVITTGTGSGPIGNGRPIAQFDLVNQRRGFSDQTVEGVAYYLGTDSGIRHTWTDTTVVAGQDYYYAVTSYDHGSDSLQFYPSENAIAPSRTPRGGLILPKNVVHVKPEPKVPGYIGPRLEEVIHLEGQGAGDVRIEIVNENLIPDDHIFKLTFETGSPSDIRAVSYTLTDSTTGEVLFTTGRDLAGEGIGPVGSGLLPVITVPEPVRLDSTRTGFTEESTPGIRLRVSYQEALSSNLRRLGYPDSITIEFDDVVRDTSRRMVGYDALPAKFRVFAHTSEGDRQLDFRFRELGTPDGTLSQEGEYFDILTERPDQPRVPWSTWRVLVDSVLAGPPGAGDVFEIRPRVSLGADDVFIFRTRGGRIDTAAGGAASWDPYVVPNPYVAAASFEPERYAISGRGERRLEFRGIPSGTTIRIYTVHGDLVQTLRHDGSDDAAVPWNLRTKDNLDVAPGLYVFHAEAGDLGTRIGKFAIIK